MRVSHAGNRTTVSQVVVIAGVATACAVGTTLAAYGVNPFAGPLALSAVFAAVLTFARPALGVALALALLPLELIDLPVGEGAVSPSEAALALVGIGWAIRAIARPDAVVLPSGRDAPIGILLLAILVGVILSPEPDRALRVFAFWTLFYAVYLQVQSFTVADTKLVVGGLAVGAGVLGTIGAIQFLETPELRVYAQSALSTRATGGFQDPNLYASILVLALLPSITLLLARPSRIVWLGVPILGALVGLFFSVSRGGVAALAIGLALLLVWRRARRALPFVIVLSIVATLVGPSLVGGSTRVDLVTNRLLTLESVDTQVDLRPKLWEAALRAGADHPLFGVGWFGFEDQANRLGVFDEQNPRAIENAHNILLSLLAETGFIGAIAFLVWLAQIASRAVRALSTPDEEVFALGLGLGLGLVGFLAQGVSQMQLRSPVQAGAFFVCCGLLTRTACFTPATDRPQLSSGRR